MNSNYCKIDEILVSIASQKQTGELIYSNSNSEKQYTLYFVMGYLRYGTGGSDRARRWYRAVKKHCPNFAEEKLKKLEDKEPWEYQLLCQGLSENKLTLPQVRTIVNSSIKEVLFSILVSSSLTSNWTATKHQPLLPFRTLLLKSDEILASVQQLVQQSNFLGSRFTPEAPSNRNHPHLHPSV